MSQRAIININGDLIPFSEELDRIRTPGLGGSAVTWVPDADTICDQLKVTANGSYSAADAGVYGYNYVTVSVGGTSATGTKDGVKYRVTVDGSGNLVYTRI